MSEIKSNYSKQNDKQSFRIFKKHGITFLLRFAESLTDTSIAPTEIIKEPLVHFKKLDIAEIKDMKFNKKEKRVLGLRKKQHNDIYSLSIALFVPKGLKKICTSNSLNISDTDGNSSFIGFDYSRPTYQEQGDLLRRPFEIFYHSQEYSEGVFIHYLQILYVKTKCAPPINPEAIFIDVHDSGQLDPIVTSRGTKTAASKTSN